MSITCGACGAALTWCPHCHGKSLQRDEPPCPGKCNNGIISCYNCARVEEARNAIKILAAGKPFKLLIVSKEGMQLAEYSKRSQADTASRILEQEFEEEDCYAVKLYETYEEEV